MNDTYLVQVVYDVCGAYIFVHTCPGCTSEQSYELAHRILIPYRGPNPTISAAGFRADKRFSYFFSFELRM